MEGQLLFCSSQSLGVPPSPLKYSVSVRLLLKKLDKIKEGTRRVKRYIHYLRDVGRALSQDLGVSLDLGPLRK